VSTGKLVESSANTFERFVNSRGRPNWSTDGTQLMFMSCNPLGGGPCTHFVRDTATSAVRQVPQALFYTGRPHLGPDGKTAVVKGADGKGRQNLFLLNVDTGAMTVIKTLDLAKRTSDPVWSPDGRLIRYQEKHGEDAVLVERAVGTEQETVIFRTPWSNGLWVHASPDGTFVVIVRAEPDKTITINLAAVSGGEWRQLLRLPALTRVVNLQWSADGRRMIADTATPGQTRGSVGWYIPLTGPPRKLDIDMSQWVEGFSVSPDFRQIAFTAHAGEPGLSIWALENILPR
jgi:Tol biopolymer transport system component